MIYPMRKSMFRRCMLAATFLATAAVSLSAWAYWPWETIYVTSYYDANGGMIGVEAVGACGFSLIGEQSASSGQQAYRCDQLNQIEMPF